jgi:hypothetical protein
MGEYTRQGPVSKDTGRPLIIVNSGGGDYLREDQEPNVNELDSETAIAEPVRELLHQGPDVPLFLRDSSDGEKGNAQDEKDKTSE